MAKEMDERHTNMMRAHVMMTPKESQGGLKKLEVARVGSRKIRLRR